MKVLLLSVIVLVESLLGAYNWSQYCPLNYPIYNANFEFENTDIICTDGLLIRTDNDWEFYDNSGLPILDAIKKDENNLFVLAGNGSWSDGLYNFSLSNQTYDVIDWFPFPRYLHFNQVDQRYWIGSTSGLYRSYDGMYWLKDDSMQGYNNVGMNSQENHAYLVNDQGIYRWDQSDTPNIQDRQDLGSIVNDIISEASGLVASRKNPGVYWTLNDSGGDAAIYAFNSNGEHLGVYSLNGITNRDWEDLAIGGGTYQQPYLYIGDIGDNNSQYDIKYIYRIVEPDVESTQSPVTETINYIETISVQYPEGNYNAETLMVDPLTNDVYIVTKRWLDYQGGTDKVFRATYPQSTTETIILDEVAQLDYLPSLVPFSENYAGATAGDISPIGDEMLIKTYNHVYHWKRNQGQSLTEMMQNEYHILDYIIEPQGEAICWEPDGTGYYTVSEEPSSFFPAHLYFYDLITWQFVSDFAALKGFTFNSNGDVYAFMPGESYSSGLYKSTDLGENWDVCFWDINISSIAMDCNDVIFIGWDNDGVGIWNDQMDQPEMLNIGLSNISINNIIDFPIIDCPSILACTGNGAYFITEYVDSDEYDLPDRTMELSNYPNPFNPMTTIFFSVSEDQDYTLSVYNIKSQKIRELCNGIYPKGIHSVIWDGTDDNNNSVSSGIYYCKIESGSNVAVKKMVLVK